MFISLLIVAICAYVFLESLSVATESRGLQTYFDELICRANIYDNDDGLTIISKMWIQFVKECAPFCQVVRYVLNASAALIVAYWPWQTIKTQIINHLLHTNYTPPEYTPWLLLIAFSLMFNVWGRMVYRVVGDRRVNSRRAAA